jgi:RimJ/RimL family protein N-acetyltransferase
MRLLALDTPELLELVSQWLGKEENCKWLDFGNGVQALTPAMIKIMTQRGLHLLRVYTADDEIPAGVAGLSNVDRKFKTATVWAVLGNKRYGGCTTRAVSELLTLGFAELGLASVSAWTVETNVAARRTLERLGFKYVGRQRQCHWIDGRAYDRLLFDLLAAEHVAAVPEARVHG